jgi:hypothetical protein
MDFNLFIIKDGNDKMYYIDKDFIVNKCKIKFFFLTSEVKICTVPGTFCLFEFLM